MGQWRRHPGAPTWEWVNQWQHEQDPGYEYSQPGERAIDLYGHEVFVGDRLAVALTAGRSAMLAVGEVVAITPRQSEYRSSNLVRYSIRLEWEKRSYWNTERSTIDASLRKYLKL